MTEPPVLEQNQDARAPSQTVAILLATLNGADFLEDQLLSLAAQTYQSIDIWASDDGSADGTPAILSNWRGRWNKGRFDISDGPRSGFAENFRVLITNPAIEAGYYAFCDQDDLWEADKLAAALAWMGTQDGSRPLLFCSRTRTIAESGTPVGMSPLFRRQPSFRNALVQSLAGGNTIVLNRAARDLMAIASRRARFVSHDWWAYMLVTGAAGAVHYSSEPLVRYRQHADNLVGANTSPMARLARLKLLLGGQFTDWSEVNLAGLDVNRDLLTPDAIAAMEFFASARKSNPVSAMKYLHKSGVYRQTQLGTLALWAAVVLGLM